MRRLLEELAEIEMAVRRISFRPLFSAYAEQKTQLAIWANPGVLSGKHR
jgi:hypothetical protein